MYNNTESASNTCRNIFVTDLKFIYSILYELINLSCDRINISDQKCICFTEYACFNVNDMLS